MKRAAAVAATEPDKSASRGIQSAIVGFEVLRVMLDGKGPMQLREIAAGANMAPSNVHRYLVSFVNVGMVVQDPVTGRYDLGPFAIRMGLAALGRIDGVEVMAAGLSRLVEQAGIDGHTTIWGTTGPVVLRWRGQPGHIGVRVMEGTVLPVAGSATGRVWACFLPPAQVKPFVQREIADAARTGGSSRAQFLARFEKSLQSIRQCGYSRSSGELRSGIEAIAAPVFGSDGQIAFTLTLIGPTNTVDVSPGGHAVRNILDAATELSGRLGARVASPRR